MGIHEHMWNNFLLPVDKDREIFKAKELLRVEYNPDRIIQHYHKANNDTRLLLAALGETVTDKDIKRNASATFEKTYWPQGSMLGLKQISRNNMAQNENTF